MTSRAVVVAPHGVVAASQPLAASAGLHVLQQGGTFADAAIATSAVLAVVEPMASHLGGDAFIITYDATTHETTALNGSGAAPMEARPERFPNGIPLRGIGSASVPGLVAAWRELLALYGTMPLEDLLRPAIDYARNGFPVGRRLAQACQAAFDTGEQWVGPMLNGLFGLSAPPRQGDVVVQPNLAWSLSQIAAEGPQTFYRGEIATRIARFAAANGGWMAASDLSRHRTQVSDPIRTNYRGYTLHGQPPVSQGHILLQEMNLLEGFDLSGMGAGSTSTIHHMVEAKKLAFADRHAYLGDPDRVDIPLEKLLSKEYAASRRQLIDPDRASATPKAGAVEHDTTYFLVADEAGNAASFIQSVFHGFGCGAVAEGTGILFNNRMTGFSLDTESPNFLVPGRRTAHTLNAYLVTHGSELAWVGGTPGGDVQVQSNMQVLCNIIDFGMDPQEAVEAPRWQHSSPDDSVGVLEIESRCAAEAIAGLRSKGHVVNEIPPWSHGSSYQLLWRDPQTGAYHAGSDPRCDGHAVGY